MARLVVHGWCLGVRVKPHPAASTIPQSGVSGDGDRSYNSSGAQEWRLGAGSKGMADKLDIGDAFPSLALNLADGRSITVPDDLGGLYRVILLYRGHW